MKFDGSWKPPPPLDGEEASVASLPRFALVDYLLEEQADLNAVERFAQFHEEAVEPLQGRYYRALFPARPPGPGQQLAFEVDLDRCSGCKACVAGCHTLNGLDEGESWRDVGLMIGGSTGLPVLQHVTSACHHCLDPACLNACPVDAYEKDPLTGIVRHLDDQCFGCQYCTLACPYDAPKFHPGKGIVRKCDMCSDRLAASEAPACVQSCPHEAIRIAVVDREDVLARAQRGDFLPASPDPSLALPTTSYVTSHPVRLEDARSADDHRVETEPAHWPLIVMLVLTQWSVGGFVAELFFIAVGAHGGQGVSLNSILCLLVGVAALTASLLHLGRPLYAYRALLGLWHSWLSREVLAFGLFAKLATAYVALGFFWPAQFAGALELRLALLVTVVAAGFAGVACSVMVYHAVQRPFWRATVVGAKFAGTMIVLGLASALAALGAAALCTPELLRGQTSSWLFSAMTIGLVASSSAKLWFEGRLVRRFARSYEASLRKTELLLRGPLRRPAGLRRLLGVVGGVVLPTLAMVGALASDTATAAAAAGLAMAASLSGELAERYLFFTAVVRPKMPGRLLP
jgi:Fe-S-cluster-containing dehydrogenase component/DMSO reductase anchor subunit